MARNSGVDRTAPAIGARTYIQRVEMFPETNAGPIERAGFIEAPVYGPAKYASRPTVAPTAKATNGTVACFADEEKKMTAMSKKESSTSKANVLKMDRPGQAGLTLGWRSAEKCRAGRPLP